MTRKPLSGQEKILHLKMLCRMGRMSGWSEEDLRQKLAPHGTSEEVCDSLRETFAIPNDELERQKTALTTSFELTGELLRKTGGSNIDPKGFDDADRIAVSMAHMALGLQSRKGMS